MENLTKIIERKCLKNSNIELIKNENCIKVNYLALNKEISTSYEFKKADNLITYTKSYKNRYGKLINGVRKSSEQYFINQLQKFNIIFGMI